jgi:hypothetical protein
MTTTLEITRGSLPNSMVPVTVAATRVGLAASTLRSWVIAGKIDSARPVDGPLMVDIGGVREAAAPIRLKRKPALALELYTAEIARRGGETSITGQYRTENLAITHQVDGLALLHAEGWRQYSKRFGARRAALSYLCGCEDGQLWAVRVPGTLTTVGEARYWVTPAEVRDAQDRGKTVVRQGDIYAVETTRAHDGKGVAELPGRHSWDAAARTLTHPQHPALHLPNPVRFLRQRVYEMGRGGGRAYGD